MSAAHPLQTTSQQGWAVADSLWWAFSTGLIVLGLAGIVLPALPGTVLVLAGIVVGAWIDDFTRVGWFAIATSTALAALAWVLDYVAALLGAKRAGASRQAVIGAALGTVAGIFMGLIGVFFMPLVGAAIGEFMARQDHHRAVKVGVATWLGLMADMLAKVVLAFMMVGLYLVALLV
ncbi:MAG: putative rane protein [Polaromonas sp.]|nr:putative rane protein [Polaromonas sp.]